MSSPTYILRPANAKGLCPVSLRYRCKDKPFEKGIGVSVAPGNFDERSGRVTGQPDAPELTELIGVIRYRIDRAARKLVEQGIELTHAALAAAYATELRMKQQLAAAVPVAQKKALGVLERMRVELVELEAKVLALKEEIREAELREGINNTHLLATYCLAYRDSKKKTVAESTYRSYETLNKLVLAYNPLWDMREVNAASLGAFEQWLIDLGKRNLTISDMLSKTKTVCYAYAKPLGLDVNEIRSHKLSVKRKRNPNPIYLKSNELQELIDLPLVEEHEARARAPFALMCLLGVRFSDSAISPESILNGELLFSTEKTDTDVTVPLGSRAKAILERYNYTLPKTDLANFNKQLKRVVAQVPSLQYKISIKTYKGANKPDKKGFLKWQKISSHVARRTFINLALERGVNPVTIAAVVGHSGTDLIMKTYGNAHAGKEKLAELLAE